MPLVPINPNPDFSTNLTGWSAFGGAITRIDVSADPPPVGDTWAMRLTPDGVTNTPRAFTGLTQITGIIPGNNYYARMVAKCNIERDVFFVITWYTSANAVISSSTLFNSFEADVWDYWEGRVVAPPLAAKAQLVPQMPGVASGTDLLDVAWCGFGVDFTSSGPLTATSEIAATVDGVGDRIADTFIIGSTSAIGGKNSSGSGSAGELLANSGTGIKVGLGTNLVHIPTGNWDFEENSTGWAPNSGTTLTRVATPGDHPFPSSFSLLVTPNGSTPIPLASGPLTDVVPGHEYYVRGYAYSEVSQQVRFRIGYYDEDDNPLGTGTSDVTQNLSTITWTEFEGPLSTAPENAAKARVQFAILNTPAATDVAWFDQARVFPRDAVLTGGSIVGGKDMESGPASAGMKMAATAQGIAAVSTVNFSDFPPLRARLRVYEPDGVLRGQLPLPLGWQAAFPLNDLSSITLEYLTKVPGVALLAAPCEVALELSDENNVFTEYPNCRFINIRQNQDLTDPSKPTSITMPSYGWMLSKVRNINTAALNDEGNRPFSNVTVGTILNTFLNEAHTRGNVPFLVSDFSNLVDSAGVAWGTVLSMSFTVGQDLLSILRVLTDQGQCDWRFNGRTLQVYKIDTFLNRNMTTNPTAVILHPQRDVTQAPDERSYEEIANTILVQGDENKYVTLEQAVNPSPWGDWETFMQQGGVTDTTVMTALGLRALSLANAPRTQMTRELMFRSQSPLPLIDYRPGDNILAKDELDTYDTLRVRQLTLQMNGEAFSGNVVLGDKFTEADIRTKRRLQALSQNAPIIGGTGVPATTLPLPVEDIRVPNQATNLALGSSTFVDTQGVTRGMISAAWSPVTGATNGDTVDIQTYRIRFRVNLSSENWRQISVDGSQTSALWGDGVDVLKTYVAQVAAVGQNGKQGAWSTAATVAVQADQTAPPVPSNPSATTRLGTIRVRWNGRDEDNLPMPVDFLHVEVEIASTASGPWTPIGVIPTSGLDLVIVDQPYNQARFFRLRSIDRTGNTSAYTTDTVSVTTTPLVNADIIGQILDGTKIVPNSINAADKVVANTITGGLIQALTITGDKIAANSITADKIVAGSITSEKIEAYSIDVSRLAIGGNGRNLIPDANASDPELAALRVSQSNGSPNTSSSLEWSDPGAGFWRCQPDAVAATAVGRLNLLAYSGSEPNLANGSVAIAPKFAFPYDQEQGSLAASFNIRTSLTSGTWPAGTSFGARMYVRWVLKDGSNSSISQLVGTTTFSSVQDWVTLKSNNFVIPPVGAVAVIPYIYLTWTNTNVRVQVDIANVFLAQKNGTVLIENGAITADQIAANTITAAEIAADAITTDTLDATAITAKHTITGSVIQTGTSGNRVKMSPNANFLAQAGVTFYSGGSGGRNAYAFIDSGANEGEWGAYNFAIVGPEVTTNSSGRADLSLKIGGGLYLQKQYVHTAASWAGMVCSDTNNELLLGGTFPRYAPLPDTYAMMRFQTWSFQNATISWGIDIGWVFRGNIGPNHSGTTPRYGSIEFSSPDSFAYQCNASVDTVYTAMWRGGSIG